MSRIRIFCFFLLLFPFNHLAFAETSNPPFYLSTAQKTPLVFKSIDKLREEWPAFTHHPFLQSGFNHLTLPFHYEDHSKEGHPNEALSFSFLLSNSLDWAPGCYCSRHAYFVFTRDRKIMRLLSKTYHQGVIAKAIREWDATHAVGGKIIRTKEGYYGKLQIYDNQGKEVYQQEYDQPRPYFELLGDMCVDAMTFLDVPPSDKLSALLRMQRCKDPQLLIKLGNAAFDCDRMSVYTDILLCDPEFADVRYYWALRKFWLDDDPQFYQFQIGRTLKSYLVESALCVFEPKYSVPEVGGG